MGFRLFKFRDKKRSSPDAASGPADQDPNHGNNKIPRILKRLSRQDAKRRQAEDNMRLKATSLPNAVVHVSDADLLETGFDLADLTPRNARIGDLVQTMDKRTMQRVLERDARRRAEIRKTVSTYIQSQADPETAAATGTKYDNTRQSTDSQSRHPRLDERYNQYSNNGTNTRSDNHFNGATPRDYQHETSQDASRFISDIQHDLGLKTDMVEKTSNILRNLTAQNILAQQRRFKEQNPISLDIPSSMGYDFEPENGQDSDDLYENTRPESETDDSGNFSLIQSYSQGIEEGESDIGQAVCEELPNIKTIHDPRDLSQNESPANDGSDRYETADEASDSYLESVESGSMRRISRESQEDDRLYETMLPTLDGGRYRHRPFEKLEIHQVAVRTGWQ